MITRLLVANRGEIARRVFATCRRLGLETVAVHSDADAGLAFVREADVAVRLPGSAPTDTYLRGDLIVEAARTAGADAVHPGYGFLSESADFARRVVAAGLTWVGPRPESIEQMGSKVEAKKLVAAADVPALTELSPSELTEDDLPILVKASAGGGGRGMRVVRSLDQVEARVASAADEAASAFGDPTVFCEPYVEHGRHVEVQVVADTYGTVLVLGERDCSLQRRHQKVVEETPAPGLSDGTRTALHRAARATAEAVGYVGAGTVEFLLDPETQRFWFLEMNTRLQVEHPVTECVFGVDLVELQLAVAEGASLAELRVDGPRGHAIEVRLYAEDPAHDWQPQSGTLSRFEVPGVDATFTVPAAYGLRLDTGYGAGDEVGTHYDAMLAKLVAWGPTREQAARRLAGAVRRTSVHGVRTNRALLAEVLAHPAFLAGDVSTQFFSGEALPALDPGTVGGTPPEQAGLLLAAAVSSAEEAAARRPVQRGVPSGWRNVVSAPQHATFQLAGHEVSVAFHAGRDGYALHDPVDGTEAVVTAIEAIAGGRRIVVDVDGHRVPYEVFATGDRLDIESVVGHTTLHRVPRFVDPARQVASGSLLAPMPGSVVRLDVTLGDEVAAGSPVLVLEAMKMQHSVAAPHAGTVSEIHVSVGDQVAAGDVLAVVQQEEER